MDLVGDDPDVAPRAGGGHALQVRALEHAPDGLWGCRAGMRACARAAPAANVSSPPCSGRRAPGERVLVAREAMIAAARRIGG